MSDGEHAGRPVPDALERPRLLPGHARRRGAHHGAGAPCRCSAQRSSRAVESGVPTVYLSFSQRAVRQLRRGRASCTTSIMAEHPDAELYLVDTHAGLGGRGAAGARGACSQRDKGLTARELAQWAERGALLRGRRVHGGGPGVRCAAAGAFPGSVAYAGFEAGREAPAHHRDRTASCRWRAWRAGARRASSSWPSTTRSAWPESVPGQLRGGGGRRLPEGRRPPQGGAGARLDDSILFLECEHRPGHRQPCGARHDRGGVLGRRQAAKSMSVADRIARKVKGTSED